MSKPLHILLIDDDEDDYFLTEDYLRDIEEFDFELEWAGTYAGGLAAVQAKPHDLLLVDYRLGPKTGIDLLEEVRSLGIQTPLVILTGRGDEKIAVAAMKGGAGDYLAKSDLDGPLLALTIRRTLEKARSQSALSQQQAKYESLFNNAQESVFILDLNFHFQQTNPAFQSLLGFVKEELTEHSLETIFDVREVAGAVLDALGNGRRVQLDKVVLRTKSGEKIPCTFNAHVMKDGENILGYQGIIHNISHLLRAEKEIRIAEKLSMTGRMARAIAHEVRNPLTNIMLSAKQMESDLKGVSQDAEMYLGILLRNANRINELITDLLESSKPSPLQRAETDMETLLEDTCALCQDRVLLLGIDFQKSYPEKPLVAHVDGPKVKIALLNILTNAIEAMEDSPHPQLSLSVEAGSLEVRVKICDNGKGMTEEQKERLFDPFFTQKKNGMGLGLTTTRTIIDSHLGGIEVQSQVGEGTCFTISLPYGDH